MLSTIKIPEKVYVGFQGRRSEDEVPLGFMTPYTTDQAGVKRRASVDNWAKGYYSNTEKTFNSVILDNKPMIGFKIGRDIRRSGGWNGSGASYVRVADPRGFELEITIENLVMCMSSNLVDNGEIIQECVWGRDGNRNILLPTNSEPFKDSVQTKAKLDTVISLRQVKPGDEIALITGETGIYLGSMFPINVDRYRRPRKFAIGADKRYVIKITDRHGVKFEGRKTMKVTEIIKAAEKKMTLNEIEQEIIAGLAVSKLCCVDIAGSSYSQNTRAWITGDNYTVVGKTEINHTEAEIKGDESFEQIGIYAEDDKKQFLELSYQFRENFVSSRHRKDRYYDDGSQSRYHSGYNYNQNYKKAYVFTTGFIGQSINIGDYVTSNSDNTTHFEEGDVTRFFSMVFDLKTKAGEIIKCIL
jgi:hypothetical protein